MISAMVKVYNDVWHIGNCLNNIYDVFDEIVIIEGAWDSLLDENIPGYNTRRSSDGTLDVINEFVKAKNGNKIKYAQIDDSRKSQPPFDTYPHLFWDVTECKEGDYAIIIDSDEIYKKADARKIASCCKGAVSRMSVWAYNLVDIDVFRSDSYFGPMGIGGRIEEFGKFHTDRFFTSKEHGGDFVVPGVWCFHYSLYKPLIHLQYKYEYKPTIRTCWEVRGNRAVFIDGTEMIKYTGELPEGYYRV